MRVNIREQRARTPSWLFAEVRTALANNFPSSIRALSLTLLEICFSLVFPLDVESTPSVD